MSLPMPFPTQSYWQTPPHRLATYRSPFPDRADVVIIGSGITGSSVAKELFEQDPALKLVIVEGRTLCSGATGRNGGHCNPVLITASYLQWARRVEKKGIEESIVISRFENAHLSALTALAKKYNLKCDLRELETVDAYYDHAAFERGNAAARAISKHVPELVHHIYAAKEAQDKFCLSTNCVGAITYTAGQLWPYKLVTQLVEMLVSNGVNLQTETPVTKIAREGDKWRVETPRGNIVASKVVHAANGFTQYLLPSFSSIIKPSRGHMTVQIPPKSLSDPPLNRSYSFLYADGKFDYFIQQPVYDGSKLLFGGGYYDDPRPNTPNDAETTESVELYLLNQLPKLFRWEGEENPEQRMYMTWSGIMGFSEDEFPWVGPLSETLGGGEGQWICAGYTGQGMVNALLCAQAAAMMILGKEPPKYFPRSFLVTSKRFEEADKAARAEMGEVKVF